MLNTPSVQQFVRVRDKGQLIFEGSGVKHDELICPISPFQSNGLYLLQSRPLVALNDEMGPGLWVLKALKEADLEKLLDRLLYLRL